MPGIACTTPALSIKILSHVHKGVDRHGYDAILGASGLHRLGMGINKDTGKVYVKRRAPLRRV